MKKKNMKSSSACSSSSGIADKSVKSESELESQKKKKQKNMKSSSACSSSNGIADKSVRSEAELELQKKK